MLSEISKMQKDTYHMISLMWNLKTETKTMNKQNMTKTNSQVQRTISGSQGARGLEMDEGGNYMVMDGNQTCGGDHSVVYTDVVL